MLREYFLDICKKDFQLPFRRLTMSALVDKVNYFAPVGYNIDDDPFDHQQAYLFLLTFLNELFSAHDYPSLGIYDSIHSGPLNDSYQLGGKLILLISSSLLPESFGNHNLEGSLHPDCIKVNEVGCYELRSINFLQVGGFANTKDASSFKSV